VTRGAAAGAPATSGFRRPFFLRLPFLAVALALAAAWHGAEGRLSDLLGPSARAAILDLARGFLPPAHDAALLARLLPLLADTVAIAVAGLGLATIAAAPLAVLATSPSVHAACGRPAGAARRSVFLGARALLAILRAVPEIVWALLFVRVLGIGPAAGVLALAVSYTGVLGKVFAEILESVPRAPAEALSASGARPGAALLLGIGPAARPLLASYALYRLDCALRSSAVLGMVGAGGIGQEIELSLRMFEHDVVATLVLALFLLVGAVDGLSWVARRWLRARPSLFPASAGAAARAAAGGLAALGALAGALAWLGVSPAALLSPAAARAAAAFARGLWPPELSPALAGRLVPAALETLAVSVLGTALAAAAGIVLGAAAAPRLAALAGGRPSGRALGVRALAIAARGVLAFARTLPELLWALLLTFAVGLGPFAGALALGVHTAGVLGRLYAEALEEVPEGPLLALRAAGASPLAALLHGVLPQAFPQLVAYTLYRWEVNIRAAAVLGVVGAGGLGRDLHVALSLFHYGTAATLVLAVLALVLAVDLASAALRARLVAGGSRAEIGVACRPGEAPVAARAW
jgi:phosphonate transport system permease protein